MISPLPNITTNSYVAILNKAKKNFNSPGHAADAPSKLRKKSVHLIYVPIPVLFVTPGDQILGRWSFAVDVTRESAIVTIIDGFPTYLTNKTDRNSKKEEIAERTCP